MSDLPNVTIFTRVPTYGQTKPVIVLPLPFKQPT
jgi:hypothetical protein